MSNKLAFACLPTGQFVKNQTASVQFSSVQFSYDAPYAPIGRIVHAARTSACPSVPYELLTMGGAKSLKLEGRGARARA